MGTDPRNSRNFSCGNFFCNMSAERICMGLFSFRPNADFVWTLFIDIRLYILNHKTLQATSCQLGNIQNTEALTN
jgi:hypothetical protein